MVRPLLFPGGDIGRLAVCGTANDLAMSGARPRYLSCALIIEEGLPFAELGAILGSMADSARELGMALVTGDTKVVEKGSGDGLYINTSGVGSIADGVDIAPQRIAGGDLVIVSGDIGRHGMAVMAQRESLQFENPLHSDCAPLWPAVEALLAAGVEVHCLRDLTRGGLATALVELAESAGRCMEVDEAAIPVSAAVSGACEMLGMDPCHVANEGRFVAFVAEHQGDRALRVLRRLPVAAAGCVIGRVTQSSARPRVIGRTALGSQRLMERLPGELLPRIC